MDDSIILENLFTKYDNEIHFELFKESNIIKNNNNDKGNFDRETNFNAQSLAPKMINYKDAYILLEIQLDVGYDAGDQGKKKISKEIYLKNNYELVESLKISPNNVIISNEANINRSSLVNYVLNDSNKDFTNYRNLQINTSTEEDLNITDNQFIIKTTYYPAPGQEVDDDTSDKFHHINFEMPVFLKDISHFFKNIDILRLAEFNININFTDNMIASKRTKVKTNIKSCFCM